MINGEVSVMERPATVELTQADVDSRFRDMAAQLIDHIVDHAGEYMDAFRQMNMAFTSLSADTNGTDQGYTETQLSALTAANFTTDTLAGVDKAAASRYAAQAEQNHFIYNVLLAEKGKKEKADA